MYLGNSHKYVGVCHIRVLTMHDITTMSNCRPLRRMIWIHATRIAVWFVDGINYGWVHDAQFAWSISGLSLGSCCSHHCPYKVPAITDQH